MVFVPAMHNGSCKCLASRRHSPPSIPLLFVQIGLLRASHFHHHASSAANKVDPRTPQNTPNPQK
eukprot:650081-Amphidinium_carterae.1